MSFVTTLPEALAAAAAQLQGIGSALASQNAAAAAPTTGVTPAAADEVSGLQAGVFSTYGNLYQSISSEATAIHEAFVNALGLSGGSYASTDAANATAATSPFDLFNNLLNGTIGATGLGGLSSPLGNIVNIGGGNWASAASDLLGLAGGGLFSAPEAAAESEGGDALGAGLGGGLAGAVLSDTVAPAGSAGLGGAGLGAMPVLAGVGQASAVGGLSVPPSWAGEPGAAVGAPPARLAGMGWTAAAPESTPVATTVPAGMPSVATAGKAAGLGAPRYGVKPTVMPKPAVV